MTEQQREVLKRAVKMLREEALGIQQGHTLSGNWDGEEEAKSAHDEMLAVASQLEALSHAERREFKTEQDLISFLDGLYETAGPDSSALTGQKWVAAQRAIEGIRSHAEGEAVPVAEITIDRHGDAHFKACPNYLDLDQGTYQLYTHPAPQVAVPEDAAQDRRIVSAMAADLGRIAEALDIDPDEGGAAPILAAINEMKSRCAVPSGWKPVPVEPTNEMISAGADASNAYRVDIMRSYDAMLAAAPTAPAGELVTRCTAGLGCEEKGHCDAAATGQGDMCDRRTMAHEQPVSDPDGLPEPGRREAEQAYINGAFDYARDPIGSRDWVLFWNGWQARDKSAPAPDEREIAAKAINDAAQYAQDWIEKQGTVTPESAAALDAVQAYSNSLEKKS